MDFWICQTPTASPAEPGDSLPFNAAFFDERQLAHQTPGEGYCSSPILNCNCFAISALMLS